MTRLDAAMSPTPARIVKTLAITAAFVGVVLVGVWALTGGGTLWPIHAVLGMGLALAIVTWAIVVVDRPQIRERTGGSAVVAAGAGVGVAIVAYTILLWAVTGAGYFWPAWSTLGLGVAAMVVFVIAFSRREQARAHRIEKLETSRSGAVDLQESELRRIERDLHDGAQARLVALGMSLGLAEEKLGTDPEGAQALLAEARGDAKLALEELRDLARGIHPPILTDRGLEAAVRALVGRSPLQVRVEADIGGRPPPAVETAAYFVVAEAFANAGKYGAPERVDVRLATSDGLLTVQVVDDGRGGADLSGAGLTGLRQRVEALDGRLQVSSPPGGPTTVAAEFPCG